MDLHALGHAHLVLDSGQVVGGGHLYSSYNSRMSRTQMDHEYRWTCIRSITNTDGRRVQMDHEYIWTTSIDGPACAGPRASRAQLWPGSCRGPAQTRSKITCLCTTQLSISTKKLLISTSKIDGRIQMDESRWTNLDGRIQMDESRWTNIYKRIQMDGCRRTCMRWAMRISCSTLARQLSGSEATCIQITRFSCCTVLEIYVFMVLGSG